MHSLEVNRPLGLVARTCSPTERRPGIHTAEEWSVYCGGVRINITIPDDLHAEIKALTDGGDAESVSGFLATAARRALAYARDTRTLDELFGPASPEEKALVDTMRRTGLPGDTA
jgi:hypothetical protein